MNDAYNEIIATYDKETMEEIAGVAGGLKRHLELAEKESAGEHLALNLTTMCWYHLDDGDWSYIGQSVFEGE